MQFQQAHNLNLKCATHQKEILGICIDKNCKKSRLVCFKCSYLLHSSHSKHILPINDILDEEKTLRSQNICLFPIIKKLQTDINELNETKNISISELYQKMSHDIKANFKMVNEQTVQAYKDSEEGRAQYIAELKVNYENTYNLNEVCDLLTLYSNGEINHEELQMNLERFLNYESDEKKSHIEKLSNLLSQDRVKQYLQFDPKQFEEKSKLIMKQIPAIEKCFRQQSGSVPSFQFEVLPIKEHTKATVSQDLQEFKLTGKVVIASNIILEPEGTYTVHYRVTQFSQGCITVGIETEENKNSSNYWGANPALCITCENLDAVQFLQMKGGFFASKTKSGQLLIMKFCQKTNIFQLSDENEQQIFRCTSPLLDKKWRLHIFNYSGGQSTFKIENVSWDSQELK